ncbi:MAG TPA: hypothetical protein VEA16_13300 [Vicinamibacterales bacterium]|nr:hypothetical protein [Vicinamibacterales bacterium]
MNTLRSLLVAGALAVLVPAPTFAQTVHLPPVFRPVLLKNTPVLTFRAKECSDAIAKIGVQEGQLVVVHRGGTIDLIPLGNRKIRDVVAEVGSKYAEHLDRFETDYPLLSTTYLAESVPKSLACGDGTDDAKHQVFLRRLDAAQAKEHADRAAARLAAAQGDERANAQAEKEQRDTMNRLAEQSVERARLRLAALAPQVEIVANSGEPDVTIGFGVVMSPTTPRTDAAGETPTGLLSGAGFQFDLIGTHLFWRPELERTVEPSRPTLKPAVYGQVRFGLHGNQELNITGEEGTALDGVGPQFETAVEQAQQVAATAHVPIAWSLFDNRMDLILTPSYGVTWTAIDPYAFPSIQVAATPKTFDAVFGTDLVRAAKARLDRVLPLSEWSGQSMFHIRRGENTLFYFGLGAGRKQTPERTIQFTTDEAPLTEPRPSRNPNSERAVRRYTCQTRCPAIAVDPTPGSLQANYQTPWNGFWQLVFGWRMAGVIDLRIDATKPFNPESGEPILRVVIGRAFPIRAQ